MSNQPSAEVPASGAQKRRRPSKRVLVVASAATGVVALLATGAIIGIPKILHAQHVSEYHDVTGKYAQVSDETSMLRAQTDAAIGLFDLQHAEAEQISEDLHTLGKTAAPIFTADQATGILDAQIVLAEALEEEPATESEQGVTLSGAVDELRSADQEAKELADEQGEELPEPTVAATYLELSVDEAQRIAFAAGPREALNIVEDTEVDRAVVEDATKSLDRAEKAKAKAEEDLEVAQAKLSSLSDALTESFAALTPAAEGAPDQANEVVLASTKAGDTQKLTDAADAVSATSDSTIETKQLLEAYVAQAKSIQAAHTKAVEQEKAKQAAAAGAGGYTDPGTGNYVYVDPGYSGGNNYSGGTSSSSGSGGGTSNNGGTSNGGGYDPNYTPPGPSCVPPPAGWYPTGGTSNGCPTYNPPGGDADEW